MAAPLQLCQAAFPVPGTATDSRAAASRESLAPVRGMHSNQTDFPLKLPTSIGALDLSLM